MTETATRKPAPAVHIRAEVAAKLYARPAPQRAKPARAVASGLDAPTPITVGQVFRTGLVLLVGLVFAPLSQIDAPAAPPAVAPAVVASAAK